MKIAKLVVCLGSVAMAWASAAKSFEVNFSNPAEVGGTELKPGAYTVEVAGDKAMIHGKKQTVEVPIKVEESDQRYSSTMVKYTVVDGKYRVGEIWLGRTKTKLIFQN